MLFIKLYEKTWMEICVISLWILLEQIIICDSFLIKGLILFTGYLPMWMR